MRRRVGRIVLAVALAALLVLVVGRMAVGFYTDILWYDALGYLSTFWTRFRLGLLVRGAAALFAAVVVYLNLWWVARNLGPVRVRRRYGNIEIAERIPRQYVLGTATVIALLGGWWLAELQFDDAAVLAVASWLRQVPWAVADPLFGRDVGFYVFALPVAAGLLSFLILITLWTVALVALGHVLVGGISWAEDQVTFTPPARRHLAVLVATLLVLLGIRYWLGRYFLLIEGHGVAGALGHTDVEVRLPVYWVMAGLTLAAAASVVYGAWRRHLLAPVVGIGVLLAGGLVLTVVYPTLVQKFQVEPNELSREAPFIRWHLAFTRRAFALDEMTRQRFPYVPGARPSQERLDPLLARLPLWDPEPLERTFNEIQALYLYYWFPDVDYGRYGEPGRERQVGIGVREFQPSGLEAGARTWQSLHLNPSYIRGMGAVVAPAHPEAGTSEPELWIRNVNPVISDLDAPASLALERPSVFFGEAMSGYVVVIPGRDGQFTGTPGVDYPRGIPLNSSFRVLAFAWRFGDETLLFSGEVSRDSRLVFRRSVRERLEALAPFLLWDSDPLPVIHRGAIVWMVDGYTTSSSFPLSRSVSVGRQSVRSLRASVKAVVDAVTGEVQLYAVAEDPILATYRRVFPDLVRPLAELPPDLRRHLRYPEVALVTQAEVLQEYHLERAEAFYAGQDVWQRPQENAPAGGIRDYRPLYALQPVPMQERTEYLALIPYIARGRQNMTAILTVSNEFDRYGALTLHEFPRDQQIPGPGQVQAVIEQNPVIAPELSLLRQRGSGVDMGHLRVVPLDSTVVYVQPFFLSAEENPIPELWRVVVSDGRNVVMARSLGAAMARLLRPEAASPQESVVERAAGISWSRQALDLLDRASARLRQGDWAGYGRALDELRSLLERIQRGGMESDQP
ncbi:MAG: UPF0182 family protein [Gemmatimonadota bacterium]